MSAAPTSPTLSYRSDRYDQEGRGNRWLGVASCGLWLTTLIASGGCVVVAVHYVDGWDGLGWVLAAFVVSWIGCGLGALLGAIGAFPRRARHPYSIAGLILNLVTGLGPVTAIWLSTR